MRLGTRCAVLNDDNQILLSKRSDFNTWALPGGRLDSGELLPDAAIREVREETGLHVELVRPVGLYYQQGRSRTDVLYEAQPVGGTLLDSTRETSGNRFFDFDNLPENRYGDHYIRDARRPGSHLYTVKNTRWELITMRIQLGWRWLYNWFAGHPEPSYPPFDVHAVGIISNPQNNCILTINGTLPRFYSDGQQALNHLLDSKLNRYTESNLEWRWRGLWQNPSTDTLDFVLTASARPAANTSDNWLPAETIKAGDTHMAHYLTAQQQYPQNYIWLRTPQTDTDTHSITESDFNQRDTD
jgi:ADP-ribose pyrophosphatase YjhB (NUDIX family)